eukprot:CAMPEP_0113466704 /NCGR_PEP_ID=MMETSP0014_2-20120614/14417_1 /TAXON_ID=2857 /ORGANISM="Nitzschia sp." /LENGTH=96 /DNA_ID=CAMNT_0000358951 /DNA_START=159 /DNA_END=449 /DNA_ORIENTATION=+ /assembly_acc=CAM_ASM_000159
MELHQLQATEDAITHEMAWTTRAIDVELVNSSGKIVKADLTSIINPPPPKNGKGRGLSNINHLMQQWYLNEFYNHRSRTYRLTKLTKEIGLGHSQF